RRPRAGWRLLWPRHDVANQRAAHFQSRGGQDAALFEGFQGEIGGLVRRDYRPLHHLQERGDALQLKQMVARRKVKFSPQMSEDAVLEVLDQRFERLTVVERDAGRLVAGLPG